MSRWPAPRFSVHEVAAATVFLSLGLWIILYNFGLEGASDAAFVLGLFIALPLVYVFGERLALVETTSPTDSIEQSPDPMTVLQERYSHGLIDEREYERRVERLLETESLQRTYDRLPADHQPRDAGARNADRREAESADRH